MISMVSLQQQYGRYYKLCLKKLDMVKLLLVVITFQWMNLQFFLPITDPTLIFVSFHREYIVYILININIET